MIHFIVSIDKEVSLIRSYIRIDTNGDGDIDLK